MNTSNNYSFLHKFSQWLKESLAVKLLAIAVLMLLLLIPINIIQDIIYERQNRQHQVIREVSQDWGSAQAIMGPVLSIPYSIWKENQEGKSIEYQHVAHFLPGELDIKGNMNHEIRRRSIFDVVLYQADLDIKGSFEMPDFSSFKALQDDIHWEEAKLSFGISGMTGIKERVTVNWAGNSRTMKSGTAYPNNLPNGLSIDVPLNPEIDAYDFSIPLKLNGSEHLWIEPLGQTTTVELNSDWHSPSFMGAFLPDSREINAEGFTAKWQVLDLNRNYPQQWKNGDFKPSNTQFGVTLLLPVDEYAKNERSVKYALMVIGLTFLIFFFFEVLRKLLIHPFQYLLIGLALAVFYLLLLSLSEHFGFNHAYFISASATILLICGYSSSILKIKKLVFQLSLLLIAIYGFIFIVLQLEDYALLAGSIGVFIALALVMIYSRKVDWYNLGGREK